MVTTYAGSRATRRTCTATMSMQALVKRTFPVRAANARGWRETLLDGVCLSPEVTNDNTAQERVGPLPAFNGIAAKSPCGMIS
jgi:hypothetical protein